MRRVQSVGMIILLLSAQPLHAAGRGQVVRLRVAVGNASDGQVEALRAAARGAGADARILSRGGTRWLEIVAAPGHVAAAVEAVRAAARAQGWDIELPRRGEGHELLAVTSRSDVSQLRPQPTGQTKAILPDAPARKPALTAGLAADRAEPPARTHARLPARAIRAPPA